jgi:hypothetical protein
MIAALAMIEAAAPRDEIEAALAIQMARILADAKGSVLSRRAPHLACARRGLLYVRLGHST